MCNHFDIGQLRPYIVEGKIWGLRVKSKDMTLKKYLQIIAVGCCIATAMPTRTHGNWFGSGPETWVTVFVHGIMSIKPHVSFGNMFKFIKDEIEDTVYSKTVEYMRQNDIFFQNQPMQDIGLHRIKKESVTRGNASGAMAYVLDEFEKTFIPSGRRNDYYTYGWSGLLSARRRYSDALPLFKELENLRATYLKRGIDPKIRLIGYSHGGNILLNLGAIKEKDFPKSSLHINEAILLGMPVQPETDYWVNSPLFERVYHFYSKKDRVQPMDLFSSNRFFSDRVFKPRRGFELPKKLTQIKIKAVRLHKKAHHDSEKVIASKNFTRPSIVSGHSRLLRNVSPGHAELWFFGWTPMHYRKHYPLYPLPTSSYLPMIVHYVKELAEITPPYRSIVADIRMSHGSIILRQNRSHSAHTLIPLVPEGKMQEIVKGVMRYAPERYTDRLYNKHIQAAVKKARYYYYIKSLEKGKQVECLPCREQVSAEKP